MPGLFRKPNVTVICGRPLVHYDDDGNSDVTHLTMQGSLFQLTHKENTNMLYICLSPIYLGVLNMLTLF